MTAVTGAGAYRAKHAITKHRPTRHTQHTAESYRQRLKPNASLERLLRLARMIRREAQP